MDLYFSPLSCAMATRIALYESGDAARFHEVDGKTKRLVADDSDYLAVYSLGMVPSLRTDDGQLLTENAAILQYVADRSPQSGLAPTDAIGRTRLHQWLCFIGTELHKALFVPLLDKKSPAEMKAYVLAKNLSRLNYLNAHLTGREFLLDGFTVADAYLDDSPELDSGHSLDRHEPISRNRRLSRSSTQARQRCQSDVGRDRPLAGGARTPAGRLTLLRAARSACGPRGINGAIWRIGGR